MSPASREEETGVHDLLPPVPEVRTPGRALDSTRSPETMLTRAGLCLQ